MRWFWASIAALALAGLWFVLSPVTQRPPAPASAATSPDEVRERLIRMMSERVGELQKIDRSLARRVVVPVLGVVVAASTVGGLLLVRSGDVPNPAQSSQITVPASDLGVEIGDSMVIQK